MRLLCALIAVFVVAEGIDCACDLCIVIDQSGSLKGEWWDHAIDFLVDFVQTLDVGPDANQVAMMKFSHKTQEEFSMTAHTTTDDVANAIGGVIHEGGGTNIEKALVNSLEYCFGPGSGQRDDAQDIVLVMTDGIFKEGSNHTAKADEARANGVVIMAVGHGMENITHEDYIRSLVGPDLQYAWLEPTSSAVVSQAYLALCSDCQVDVCFVVDESASISDSDWINIQTFLLSLVDYYTIGPDGVLMGLVEFHHNAELIFDLDNNVDAVSLEADFNTMAKNGGGTQISKGITMAMTQCFGAANGDRDDVPNVMVVITDGVTKKQTREVAAAQAAADAGIIMLSIGVGAELNSGNVQAYSQNVAEHYFQPNDDFPSIFSAVVTVVDAICRADDAPLPTVTP